MNDLSNASSIQSHCYSCKPIPSQVLYVLVPLFFTGLAVSIFILIAVHNAFLFVSLLCLSALVAAFLIWNTVNWRRSRALFCYLRSFPDSDLRLARHGQLVKITGLVSCGNISLESSYEKATRCIYTSTLLYEYPGLGLKLADAKVPCFGWGLAYCERFSTDFYITDSKSGIRALVKAGSGSRVTPLIVESRLVNTTRKCRFLSSHFKKWLAERNISGQARLLRLEEGYVKEGSSMAVIGMLHRDNDALMIVQPPELLSTGCLWRKLLLPVDIDGVILGVPEMVGPVANPPSSMQQWEH
ncbi:hypothetical protein VitviT2T_023682 [Vitis vinifera]|nr:uncharacterized membrane protein At1g16860 [Vitis vinifera]WKA05734.1 hypothetical protein VitviT2T_023682 [Vitis vinifera]|eukprot:XP_010661482.1 PREDICTED: uncharacterized membrane protein At1g16860 [Vitis vinifera]